MRVYFEPPSEPSIAVSRILTALRYSLPRDAEEVSQRRHADLVVLTVIGRCERVTELAATLRQRGQRYVIIQLCVRSTQKKHTSSWLPLWHDAQFVWSYYDLPAWCREDGVEPNFTFYHAPLGVDAVFHNAMHDLPAVAPAREVTVLTSGRSWLVESIRECVMAARAVHGVPWHLGSDLKTTRGVESFVNIADTLLVEVYKRCNFVSGLRRIEGFELPAAEGLILGACPVMFDRPHYRQWFDGVAIFIPEKDRESTVRELIRVFQEGPPLSLPAHLRAEVAARFSWPLIVKGFWDRC